MGGRNWTRCCFATNQDWKAIKSKKTPPPTSKRQFPTSMTEQDHPTPHTTVVDIDYKAAHRPDDWLGGSPRTEKGFVHPASKKKQDTPVSPSRPGSIYQERPGDWLVGISPIEHSKKKVSRISAPIAIPGRFGSIKNNPFCSKNSSKTGPK